MKAMTEKIVISREVLVSFVGGLTGGNPDPDNPSPVGPWGPVIRRAFERLRWAAGPLPDPWIWAALNPQPLPPRSALVMAIAREVIDRAVFMQEIGDALPRDGQQQGIIIIGGYLSRFVDDCGNGRIRFKFPIPPPRGGEEEKLAGLDLVIMGVEFHRRAAGAAEHLREELAGAGAKLIDMGMASL